MTRFPFQARAVALLFKIAMVKLREHFSRYANR